MPEGRGGGRLGAPGRRRGELPPAERRRAAVGPLGRVRPVPPPPLPPAPLPPPLRCPPLPSAPHFKRRGRLRSGHPRGPAGTWHRDGAGEPRGAAKAGCWAVPPTLVGRRCTWRGERTRPWE
nr:REST corepressor 2-like [Taeniopygia guttata]